MIDAQQAHDPRVFFAAERTALAWIRTGSTSIAMGFMVAKFGLFLRYLGHEGNVDHHRFSASNLIGLTLVLLGSLLCAIASHQFFSFVRMLQPTGLPRTHFVHLASWAATAFAMVGLVLAGYLLR